MSEPSEFLQCRLEQWEASGAEGQGCSGCPFRPLRWLVRFRPFHWLGKQQRSGENE
ncbi:MAG: hypothetical protein KKD73_07335 [Proteobacteria bacterium]|nr:hypothetical protein [Pseudomonadota bacterium]MBU1639171.1 hypothetical protein [Pseudomonadota bacterium]